MNASRRIRGRVSAWIAAFAVFPFVAFAQSRNIVTAEVTYSAWLHQTGSETSPFYQVQFAGDTLMNYYGGTLDTAPRTTQLEVGRRYTINLTGVGTRYDSQCFCYHPDLMPFSFNLNFSVVGDYVVYIEGIKGGYAGSTYGTISLNIAIGPAGGCAACGPGSDYDVETQETRLAWTVKLGRNSSGTLVDPLKLSTNLVNNATFTRDELNFSARSSDVERIPSVGALRQILLPAALLDVIDVNDGFDLKFYSRDYVTTKNGAGEWQLAPGAAAYVTYHWLSGQPGNNSPSSATFTRTATTTEQTYLQRNATTGRWTKNEPAYGYEETVKVSDTVETTNWKDTAGTTIRTVTRTYAEPLTGQREVVQEVDGASRTTTWVWYGDTGYPGSKGKLNWSKGPDGSYSVYTYWNEAGPAAGRVARVYTPYKDAPTDPASSETVLQTGRWSEYFWASDINGVGNLLASRIDHVGSTIVGQVTGTHDNATSANGKTLLTSVYKTYSTSTAYVQTTHKEYAAASATDRLYHGKTYADIASDGTQVSYVQQRGTWSGGTFTPNSTGTAWREAAIRRASSSTAGTTPMTTYLGQTIQTIWVLPYRSTITVRILDDGNSVREESYVCTAGTTFEQVTRVDREFTALGELKTATRVDPVSNQNVLVYDSNWVDNRLDWDRDSQGIKRDYQYDLRGRRWKITTEGVSGGANGLQYSQTTTYTYDAADQVRQVEVKGGLNGTLVSSTDYDLGGHVTQTTAPGGRQTAYAYQFVSGSPSYWQVKTTLPGGAEQYARYYRDGRPYQILGSAVSGTTENDYSIDPNTGNETISVKVKANNADGTLITRENRVTTDWASRNKSALGYRADTDTGTLNATTTFTYDSAGRPSRIDTDFGVSSTLFDYDPIVGWSRQALDLDAGGSIGLNSVDRIAQADGSFTKIGSTWWQVAGNSIYGEENSGASQDVAVVSTQLDNFTGATLSCVKQTDVYGQTTTATTTFDWTLKQLQTVTATPSTTNVQTTIVRNGRTASITTAQGLTFNVKYDEFGRETGGQDPRKGWSNREFVAGSNDVYREQDETDAAAGRWTATYGYDTAGRVKSVMNSSSKYARYQYNDRGLLEYQWGDTVTPVRYEYDGFGQRIRMSTYRGGSGWNGASWPTGGNTGTADTTTWVYFDYSGLVKEKRDAGYGGDTSRKVSWTYTADGLPYERQWARLITSGPNTGQRVKTTYAYTAARELSGKTYNDGTPNVSSISYNRRGQIKQVTDVTGTRTLHYDAYGFLRQEDLPAAYFGARFVGWQHDAYGRRNRVGFYGTSNWPSDPTGAQFEQTYSFAPATGQLSQLSSWSGANNNSTWRDTGVTYTTNSNQVYQLNQVWGATTYTHERILESTRDAVASFKVKNGTYEAVKATYTRDTLGRITSSSRDNSVAPDSSYNPLFRGYSSNAELKVDAGGYVYNDRHELTAENLKAFGTSWQYVDLQGVNRQRTFGYDNAQNREWAAAGGSTYDDPTPNNLNQPDKYLGANVGYDKDGNLLSDGTWTYTYDAENRLTSCSKSGVTITYQYDYVDRRVEQRSNYGSGVIAKKYVWDGWNMLADLWEDYGNAVACTYVWGPDISGAIGGAGGVGGMVLVYYNGRGFVPLQDGRGNIYGYLDATTGKNAAAWDFTPYGDTLYERGGVPGQSGSWDFVFRYQSKMQDTAGHLLYFGLRYYHPGLGRFINRDPIGEAGGVNLHAYVGNNPGNGSDVLGMRPRWVVDDPGGCFPDGVGGYTCYNATGHYIDEGDVTGNASDDPFENLYQYGDPQGITGTLNFTDASGDQFIVHLTHLTYDDAQSAAAAYANLAPVFADFHRSIAPGGNYQADATGGTNVGTVTFGALTELSDAQDAYYRARATRSAANSTDGSRPVYAMDFALGGGSPGMLVSLASAAMGVENRGVLYISEDDTLELRTGGSRAWRNNNPGNIRRASSSMGAIGSAGGFAVFPDYQTGRSALLGLLVSPKYRNETIGHFLYTYSPPSENDSARYTSFMERTTGLSGSRSLGQLSPAELGTVADAIQRFEGWIVGNVQTMNAPPAGP